MDYENDQDIVLDFIDQQKLSLNKFQKRISIQTLRDQSQINFNELLQRQWTLSKPSEQFFHSKKTFHQINNHQDKQQPINDTEKAKNSLKSSTEQTKYSIISHQMRSIFTIFESPDYVQDIEMYLSSQVFHYFIKIIVFINFIGLLIADYSFRLDQAKGKNTSISIQNAISLNFQLFSNCVFTIEIILYFFSSRSILSNSWIILNIVGTLACWVTIFFDLIQNDDTVLFQVLHILRIIRGFRIIQVFDSLKDLFETFLGTLPDLGKIFFPLLIFMSFYAVVGQQLFLGSNEHKCRQTPYPNGETWNEVSWNLCGASLWKCPQNSYCRNPYDYGMSPIAGEQKRSLEFNLLGFDNFLKAMLMVYHYVFMSNFSGNIFKFSRYINPYLTTFYFVSMAVVLFYILANLVFVGLSKAYLQKEKILQKKKQNTFNSVDEEKQVTQTQQQMNDKQKYIIRIVQIFEIFLVLLQSVVILIDYKNIPQKLKDDLSVIDFFTTVIAIIVVILRVAILRMRFLKTIHNFVDIIMISCFIADVIFCVSKGYSVIYIKQVTSAALRGIKIIRIVKILYISDSFFKYERSIVNLFFQTLKNMRYFLFMLFSILLVFSFLGKMLFSYRIRFTLQKQVDLVNGLPYVVNFQSAYKSVIAVLTLFENERWTETMYNYYHATGFWGIVFFVVIVFFSHLLVTRLFMAVFFCYFRQDLEKALETKKSQNSQNTNLEENNSQNKKQKDELTVIHEHNEAQSIQKNLQQIPQQSSNFETLQNLRESNPQPLKEQQKLFWIFQKNSCFIQFIKFVHDSRPFYYFVLFGMLIHVITIVLRSNVDSKQKTNVLDSFENISIAIYCFEFLLGTISYGLYLGKNTYLKKSQFNKVNLLVIVFLIVSILPFIDPLYQMMIRRLIVIKVFTILKVRNKEMDIILRSIAKIFTNFLRVLFIYFLFILMTSVIPLKLLKDSFYNCNNYNSTNQTTLRDVNNPTYCMNAGGDWVQDAQNFDNIFNAVTLMYQIVTSQSWTYFIQLTIFKNTYWDIYFVLMFFFYNICLLNIFVGLIVETYVNLKDKAYKLNLLKPSQKGWILIKNCINELVPTPTIGSSKITNFVHQVCFKIVSNEYYNDFIDFLAYLNIILYAMTIYRSSHQYNQILMDFKIAIIIIFSLDALLKLYALRWQYFYLDNSKVQLVGFIYIIFYGLISTVTLTNQEQRIVNFFLIVFLFLRAKKFLFRFTWSKTLINSVIEILPKCIQIGSFLFLVLFVYVAIGLQVFKHVKPSSKADYYTTGFNDFYTGLTTLIKIASNESWFDQVTTFLRKSQPNDICYQINNQQDSLLHGGMGCGTYLTYPFFFSYHITMSLLIFNLLIATMVSAYDENYEKEYNSVNVFQLQDCLELWKKYDPRGTGVIAYKKFWKLSSQIGILFGISKKKLIKSKQKFLQQLDIPICQSINPEDSSVLCYRFHDVITKFSKVKLQVSLDKGDENSNAIEFDIHPMIQNQIKDYVVKVPQQLYKNYKQFKNYTSGEMKYFFGLLRKMRSWKTHSKSKGQVKVSKLSRIIKTAMDKKIQQENLKNLLAFATQQDQVLGKKRQKTLKSTKKYPSQQQQNNVVMQAQSDQSQSELVESQPVNENQIRERDAQDYFDFNLNQKQSQNEKHQKSI